MKDPSGRSLLKISTVNVSVDGARLTPEDGQVNIPVTEAAALAALTAFAGLSALDLVHANAKILLAGPRGKLAVQNEGGRLFVTSVPEAMNIASERTPEEILAELLASDRTAAMASPKDAAGAKPSTEGVRKTVWWQGKLRSGWSVATLAVIAVLVAYFTFRPDAPEGVEIIRDPAKISRLHAKFNGRYGAPNTATLVLDNGHLTGRETPAAGGAGAPLFEKDYEFGLSHGQVVLVVDNGALLEPQSKGGLKFMESSYPRLRP
jgi:hypothetical protein